MNRVRAFVLPLLVLSTFRPALACAQQTVSFPSGAQTLTGVLYKPAGEGPFPALLYNHGSAPGMQNQQAFDQLGPLFAGKGWVFFAPYRRGQGLSASAGPYVLDQIAAVQQSQTQRALPVLAAALAALLVLALVLLRRRKAWLRAVTASVLAVLGVATFMLISVNARAKAIVHVLETDHLDDHLAALEWLKQQPFVQTDRIATAGNSFGGIVTVFAAERVRYCAAIDAAGAAETWRLSAALRRRMIEAVRQAHAPIFFFQAVNDHTVAPTRELSEQMRAAGKPFGMKIYPAFGDSAAAGHAFAWRGSAQWAPDVFAFLEANCD